MKKYFVTALIVTLHANAMEDTAEDIKKHIILYTANYTDYKKSIKTVRSLALVNKNFNQLINDKEVTKRLIEIIGSCKAMATFKKNQKKTKTSDNASSSSGFTNFCSNTETLSVPSEFCEKNQRIYNIIAALKLSTAGTKNWFEKEYLTKKNKQELLKFMAGTDLLMTKIAPLCGGIPSFNEQASLINDDLKLCISGINKKARRWQHDASAIILGTPRALCDVETLTAENNFDLFNDILLTKQTARWLKQEGKIECIKRKLGIDINPLSYFSNRLERLKRIRLLLKIIKDTIPENNTYLLQALDDPQIVEIVTNVLDEKQYNIKALDLNLLILHDYYYLFDEYIKTPEFNIKQLTIDHLKNAIMHNRKDMFSLLFSSIVDKKQATKKQLPFKDIIFTAIEVKNDFFFDQLLKHELFYTNFTKQTPLQHAVLKGKLDRASKILEKITKPDPKALKFAQEFSYGEFVEKYNNKKFNNHKTTEFKNNLSDKPKRKSDCCIF